MAEALFGVRDTLRAGRLCLLWGAMAHDPGRFRRPRGYEELVAQWAGGLAGPTPDEPNIARTWRQPMLWALDAVRFERRRARRLQAGIVSEGIGGARDGRRGRPPSALTRQRADFAKTLIDEGLQWLEIHARYLRR